jgi:cell division protein FtsQ
MRKRSRNQLSNTVMRTRQRRRAKVFLCMNVCLLFLLCYGVYFLGSWLHRSNAFKLKYFHVNVEGDYVPKKVFLQRIKSHVHGGFFGFDAETMKRILMQDPWVKSVYIRRVFPNALDVSIKERTPFAYWNASGVITRQGEVFFPQEIPKLNVPHFVAAVEDRYQLIDTYESFMRLLSPIHLTIKSLRLTKSESLSLLLSNEVAVNVGNENQLRRFQQFISAYPQLQNGKLRAEAVDLRYPSGFAVKWGL